MTARRFPLADLVRCAKREHGIRLDVARFMVNSGRIGHDEADREIAMMADIVRVLEELHAAESTGSALT